MEYRYTLFVYYNNEWVPAADGDTPMDMAMFMMELQYAGYKASEMYAIDNSTGEMLTNLSLLTA